MKFKDFEKAVKEVLGAKAPKKSIYENRKPTKEELSVKWKLTHRKS